MSSFFPYGSNPKDSNPNILLTYWLCCFSAINCNPLNSPYFNSLWFSLRFLILWLFCINSSILFYNLSKVIWLTFTFSYFSYYNFSSPSSFSSSSSSYYYLIPNSVTNSSVKTINFFSYLKFFLIYWFNNETYCSLVNGSIFGFSSPSFVKIFTNGPVGKNKSVTSILYL